MIHKNHWTTMFLHGRPKKPKTTGVRDIEYADEISPAQLLDRVPGAIDAREIPKEKLEARRGRRRSDDHDLGPHGALRMGQRAPTAESVAIGVHMGSERDPAGFGQHCSRGSSRLA